MIVLHPRLKSAILLKLHFFFGYEQLIIRVLGWREQFATVERESNGRPNMNRGQREGAKTGVISFPV